MFDNHSVSHANLHTFVNASKKSYITLLYLRRKRREGHMTWLISVRIAYVSLKV